MAHLILSGAFQSSIPFSDLSCRSTFSVSISGTASSVLSGLGVCMCVFCVSLLTERGFEAAV